MDCSPPSSSVHGIFQARIQEWVTIPFSMGPSQPRDQTRVSCIAGRLFTVWAPRESLFIYLSTFLSISLLGWPKSSSGFSHRVVWKIQTNFLANPISIYLHSSWLTKFHHTGLLPLPWTCQAHFCFRATALFSARNTVLPIFICPFPLVYPVSAHLFPSLSSLPWILFKIAFAIFLLCFIFLLGLVTICLIYLVTYLSPHQNVSSGGRDWGFLFTTVSPA